MKSRACWTCPYRNPTPTYTGDKYACKKYGYNVKPDQTCVKGDKAFEFNFPQYKTVPQQSTEERLAQIRKTIGELEEAVEALEKQDEQNYLEELMDAHHSNETSLHAFTPEALAEAAQRVIEKNAQRGYYQK